MIGCSNRVMVLTFFLGLILLIGGCNSDSKETAASKAAPTPLSDQEILDLLGKAEQIPYDIQAMRDESAKIIEDDKGNCYIQLPATLDAEEKIHKLYTPYWTEEAINKFMQPYSVVKGKYCSTMGDWGEMGGHIDRVTILKKERIGKELMKINVNVKEPDGSSVQPEIYELKYVDGKWLVNLSPMMSAL